MEGGGSLVSRYSAGKLVGIIIYRPHTKLFKCDVEGLLNKIIESPDDIIYLRIKTKLGNRSCIYDSISEFRSDILDEEFELLSLNVRLTRGSVNLGDSINIKGDSEWANRMKCELMEFLNDDYARKSLSEISLFDAVMFAALISFMIGMAAGYLLYHQEVQFANLVYSVSNSQLIGENAFALLPMSAQLISMLVSLLYLSRKFDYLNKSLFSYMTGRNHRYRGYVWGLSAFLLLILLAPLTLTMVYHYPIAKYITNNLGIIMAMAGIVVTLLFEIPVAVSRYEERKFRSQNFEEQ